MVAITAVPRVLILLAIWRGAEAKSSSQKSSAITCTGAKCVEKLQWPFAILDNILVTNDTSIEGNVASTMVDDSGDGFGEMVLKLEVKISKAAWKDETKKLTLDTKHDEV